MARPIRYCTLDGCDTRAFGHGLCSKHYARMRRSGTTETTIAPQGASRRWLREVALPYEGNDCLLFPFRLGNHGYGSVGRSNAHRIICELAHGEPPPGKTDAAHSCGNRRCVNKRHIRWATSKENNADKIAHGRILYGERHPLVKLSVESVRAIREDNRPQKLIATSHGIVQQTVSDIKCRRRWAWL